MRQVHNKNVVQFIFVAPHVISGHFKERAVQLHTLELNPISFQFTVIQVDSNSSQQTKSNNQFNSTNI